MAELRDEYGNPIQLTDEYGKPVQLTMSTETQCTSRGSLPRPQRCKRPCNSSLHDPTRARPALSSSEDDGQAGRRKKGLKEKLKETFGGEKQEAEAEAATTTPESRTATTVPTEHEKKGLMEKIKEKLPGHHH